jgi:hypothetical protein
VTGLVPITLIASETLSSGTLTYYPLSNPSAVVTLNANTTTAGGGTLATLDTTVLPNGSYYIVLDATDTTGKTMGSGVDIVVGGNYKPGRVTTTVTDLVVPAPGLPIQISRTYDSLVSGTSIDFGYGWSLSINLQMQIASTNDVSFTINGQQKTFYFTPVVRQNSVGPTLKLISHDQGVGVGFRYRFPPLLSIGPRAARMRCAARERDRGMHW